MRTTVIAACSLVVAFIAAPVVPSAQMAQGPRQLELTFDGQGNVTLVAANVTIREILSEWTRLGGSRFLNVERLTGGPLPMPIQFDQQPEGEVLTSLLAGTAGYILGPRLVGTPGVSRFGTIVIQATSTATAAPAQSFGNSAVAPPPLTRGNPDDELPPVTPPVGPAAAPGTTSEQAPARPNTPSVGVPGVGVFVPIVPVNSGRGGGGTTTGRGGGGGGGGGSSPR